VEVITCQLAAFTTEIARLVDMKSMYARELGKGSTDSYTTALSRECDFTLNGSRVENCDSHIPA